MLTPAELARRIDHTLLKPEATEADVDRLCDEAVEYGFVSVFVNPAYVARAVTRLASRSTVVGSVANFPLGAADRRTVVDEAARSVDAGAREIDMVVSLGGLIRGQRESVRAMIFDVACVVHSAQAGNIVKVILETAALTREQIILGCRCAAEGEADYVKTSTGFHPSGGATVEDVALLRKHAAPLKVKASGGIRTLAQAMTLIEAGAVRIGTSAGTAIMRELAHARDRQA